MNGASHIVLRVFDDQRLAEEWELVLLAQGLSPSLRQTPNGVILSVPGAELDRALASLSAYERENPRQPTEQVRPMASGSLIAAAVAPLALLLFYSVSTKWLAALPWFERGSADAERILHGELWRTVTALTLHADVAHALSNAVALAVFLGAVSSIVGTGLGSALVLLAGAGGNLFNAFLHGSPHISVGSSTAVFGAVGLLGSLGVMRRRTGALSPWRAWLPVAAALALLGMLGSGGARVDILAHLFGLVVGALIGIPTAWFAPRPATLTIQWVCATAAIAVIISSWLLAYR